MNNLRLLIMLMMAVLFFACGEGETPGTPAVPGTDTDTEVDAGNTTDRVVSFVTGNVNAATRAPFEADTPVKIYIWQYTAQGVDFAQPPTKMASGTLEPKDADYSAVNLTSGDITYEGQLNIKSGIRYAFVMLIDATPGATLEDIVMTAGKVELTHGRFLLAAKQTVTVDYSTGPVLVKFTENGAVDGIIPHIQCAVNVEMSATQRMIDEMNYDFPLELTVESMKFIKCMPSKATLFVEKIGQDDAYQFDADADMTLPFDEAATLKWHYECLATSFHHLLPYPSRDEYGRNVLDILLKFDVNNIPFELLIDGVDVPAFKGGYRYTFVVEIDYTLQMPDTDVTLSLRVSDWGTHTWENGVGEEDEEEGEITRAPGTRIIPLGKYKGRIMNYEL